MSSISVAGVVSRVPDGVPIKVKAGRVTDSDFTVTPIDGYMALNTIGNELGIRTLGSWVWLSLAGSGGGGGGTPTLLASHAYGTANPTSWGSADIGGAWVYHEGVATDFVDSSSGYGTITTTVGVGKSTTLPPTTTDGTATVKFAVGNVISGGSIQSSIIARRQSDGSQYRARLQWATDGSITLVPQYIDGAGTASTTLATATTVISTYTAATWINVKMQCSGTAIRCKAWADSGTEPASWTFDVVDSTLGSAGTWGVRFVRNTGSANSILRVDDWQLYTP